MTIYEDAGRIANDPFFRWRRDASVQLTLGCAGLGMFAFFAGLDAFVGENAAKWPHHLVLLGLAGLAGGAFIFQVRAAVLALRWIAVAVFAAIAVTFSAAHVPALGVRGLTAGATLSVGALLRTRSSHWAAYKSYLSQPERIPHRTSA